MLFRKEVSEYQQAFRSGQVLLLRGWPAWVTVSGTVLIMLSLLLLLIFGSYTRRINVSGEIITLPHTINLFAPEQGMIARLLVHNGQVVKAGTPLYQLDIGRVTRNGSLSATTLAVLEKQRQRTESIIREIENNKKATLEGLRLQLERYDEARKSTSQMVDSASVGLRAMRESMKDYGEYRRRGLVTTDQQNNQRYLFYQQQTGWQSLNAQLIQQDLQISSLRSELIVREAEFDSQIDQYRIHIDDLQRQMAEADASGMRLVTAPVAGRVSSLGVTEGEMVGAGDSLAQLVPVNKDAWRMVIWIPGEGIPWVHPGDGINLRYTAFPFQKYGQFPGRIESISKAPVPARELQRYASAPRTPAGNVSDGWFKAVVKPDLSGLTPQGKPPPISSGMQAQATLFLETRSLWRWILSPYYSLKSSITGEVHDR